MGPRYAGVLGPLALLVVVVRGLLIGAPVRTFMLVAWVALLIFSVVGFVIGKLAESTLEDSVTSTLATEVVRQSSGTSAHHPPGE